MKNRRGTLFLLLIGFSLLFAAAGSLLSQDPPSNTASGVALPRVMAPSLPRTAFTKYPWKADIVTRVFWVGEPRGTEAPPDNVASAWDPNWRASFGGVDDPDPAKRTTADFRPIKFFPNLNPFYVALPYNDVVNSTTTKEEAKKIIPWFKETFKETGKSICRDRWVVIRHGNRVCYAQWSDCGPFVTNDASYVFGNAPPAKKPEGNDGLSVSPAVRDYLNLANGRKCDWRFAEVYEIPEGPWRLYGSNNPFTQAKTETNSAYASRLEELRKLRDEYFKKNNASKSP